MKGIGVVANWTKEKEVGLLLERINLFCSRHHIGIFVPDSEDTKRKAGLNTVPAAELKLLADFVIVMGGDGTMLRAAREFAGSGLPILGVNLGKMGFLAEVEPPVLEKSLEMLLLGQYKIRRRMMLAAAVYRDKAPVAQSVALNDVVISKGPFSRVIQLATYVNDTHLETYPSDGLIVATPTGSTGYSLSAGGPIVNPAMDVIIITPICPHLLHHRSVIVSAQERVSIQVRTHQYDVVLTVDGQVGITLLDNDVVHVTRSDLTTPLIELKGTDFYTLLHRKLSKVIETEPERK